LEASREWTYGFVLCYNEIHRQSALKYVTPGQRHCGESAAILEARKEVLEEAKRKPETPGAMERASDEKPGREEGGMAQSGEGWKSAGNFNPGKATVG